MQTYKPTENIERNNLKYEQSQKHRYLEKKVRESKLECAMLDAMGDKEGFDKAALKLKQRQQALKDFTVSTGRTMRVGRTQVFGYNKSVARKVTQGAKRQEAALRAAEAAKEAAARERTIKVATKEAELKAKNAEIRALIKSDATPKRINFGNQNKHILGSKGYIAGRSYIYGDCKLHKSLSTNMREPANRSLIVQENGRKKNLWISMSMSA